MLCLFQERQCPFAHSSQFGEHALLAGNQFRIDCDRAFAFDEAQLHNYKRNMETLRIRNRQREFANCAIGVGQNARFYLA